MLNKKDFYWMEVNVIKRGISGLVILNLFLIVCIFTQSFKAATVKYFYHGSNQSLMIKNEDLGNKIEESHSSIEVQFIFNEINYNKLLQTGDQISADTILGKISTTGDFDLSIHFQQFFRVLNLSKSQTSEINDLMKTYQNSIKSFMKEYQDSNKSIYSRTYERRKEIMDSLNNGKLTRQEVDQKARKLSLETQRKVKNNPVSIKIRNEICLLNKKLVGDIKTVLTPEQIEKFEQVIQNINFPC